MVWSARRPVVFRATSGENAAFATILNKGTRHSQIRCNPLKIGSVFPVGPMFGTPSKLHKMSGTYGSEKSINLHWIE
jgi:hypothetical protein